MVPAKGVERWLTQRLSHRLGTGARGGDGVCAGVRFLSPRSLVSMLLGRERDDAWDPDRLVWPLLEVIDASLDEPWCATLATHLGHGLDGDEALLRRNRRYSVARRLAGLYSSYAVQRPTLVTDWREGRDTDGAGAALDDDLLWQAELWRRLVARVAEPAPDVRHTRDARPAAGRRRGSRAPVPAVAVRPHPAPGHRGRAVAGAGRVPRRARLAAPAVAAAVGRPGRHRRRGPARRRRLRRRWSTTRCSRRWAATAASCAARWTRWLRCEERQRRASKPPHRSRAVTRPSSAGSRPTSAPTPTPTPTPAPPASTTPTTAPSRCTPATARPARSTCCARCWSGCCRTTRRSSRATSS